MRRKWMWMLVPVMLALLSACSTSDEAVKTSSVEYIVSFYDGASLMGQYLVGAGGYLDETPADGDAWMDRNGETADPMQTKIVSDTAFYLRRAPALTTARPLLMDAGGGKFEPETPVTRGEAAEIACRLMDRDAIPPVEGDPFADMDAGSAHYGAVSAVRALSVMRGYPDGTFRPDEPVTRAEFADILYCLLAGNAESETPFSDVPAEHWAADAVAFGADRGYLRGYADGRFYPDAPLTRACAAVILADFRGLALSPEQIDAAVGVDSPFADVPAGHWAYHAILDASYTNLMLDLANGRADGAEPGFMTLDDGLGYVDPDTMRLAWFESGFQTVNGGLYYAAHSGWTLERFESGLKELRGGMYYVPEDDGPFMTDDTLGYLYFGKDGRYTSGSDVVDGYVDDILRGIIYDDSMTQEEKLYTAYCSIRDGGYRYRRRNTGWQRGSDGWTLNCAEVMYETKAGICYYWASAFLYLARRLGYQAYAVCGGVGTRNQIHAWVVIEWDDGQDYIFDVELEWAYIHHFYSNVSYSTTDMYMQPRDNPNVLYWFPDGSVPSNYTGYYVAADDYSTPIELPDDYDEGEDPEGIEPGDEPPVEDPEDPGEDPGENPGETPGVNPGENPGETPGVNPGENPCETPGVNPGDDPGQNPGENPGGETPAEQPGGEVPVEQPGGDSGGAPDVPVEG